MSELDELAAEARAQAAAEADASADEPVEPAEPATDADADADADGTSTIDTPVAALNRRQTRRAWRRAERERRRAERKSVRFPVLTRSILVWWLVFALVGLTGGATAAFFWSHFNDEVRSLREENESLREVIDQAKGDISTQRDDAITQIAESLQPLESLALESEGVALAGLQTESVWFVSTLDAEGRPLVGSAFVVASDDQQSLLLTSYAVVRESSVVPGPEIRLRNASQEVVAGLYAWDPGQDLALLTIPTPNLPALEWASEEQAAGALGSRVFLLGGLGGAGAVAVPGLVIDQSASGIQADVPVGTSFQGGPIVTGDGKVLAVSSLAYQPLGFDPGEIRFAVPIGNSCRSVLACGGGVRNPGTEGGPPPPPPPANPNSD